MVSLIQPASPLAGKAHYQRNQLERPLPDFVQQEFDAFLKCGWLEHGFLRVQCGSCKHEDLVAFSCKKRGFCPSCDAKRIVEHAALVAKPRINLTRCHGVFAPNSAQRAQITPSQRGKGPVKIIACIEDPAVIEKILACL